ERARTMSRLCYAIVFLLLASPAIAQSHEFEAISISPAPADGPRNMRMRVRSNGDLDASGVPVLLLLGFAYDLPGHPSPRLSGLPVGRETYETGGRTPAGALPPGLSERDKRSRIQ